MFIRYLLQQSSGRVGRVPGQYKQKTGLKNLVGFWPPEAGLSVHLHQVGCDERILINAFLTLLTPLFLVLKELLMWTSTQVIVAK